MQVRSLKLIILECTAFRLMKWNLKVSQIQYNKRITKYDSHVLMWSWWMAVCAYVCVSPWVFPVVFTHTCRNKESANSSIHSSFIHSDRKSNWLHAALSRQSHTSAVMEAQRPREEQAAGDGISAHPVTPLKPTSNCLSSTFHANCLWHTKTWRNRRFIL